MAQTQRKDILIRIVRARETPLAIDERPSTNALLESTEFVGPISASFVLVRFAVVGGADTTPADSTAQTTRKQVPEFFLLDPDGNPYARSDIKSDNVSAYVREFERLHQLRVCRDWERQRLVAATTGAQRLHHLGALVATVGALAETGYPDVEQPIERPHAKQRLKWQIKEKRMAARNKPARAT